MALLPANATAAPPVGSWTVLGSDRARPLDESQGLTTVVRAGGGFIRYTGLGTIPWDVALRGWNHVGDPGSRLGYYVEPYESDTHSAKMFRVQAPDGGWTEYVHQREPGRSARTRSLPCPWTAGGSCQVSGA